MGMQFEDDLLRYMLAWETRRSETLLNVEELSKPFDYRLHSHRESETRVQQVDLLEPLNYRIGLEVEARRVLDDAGQRYLIYYHGTTRDGQHAVVIWRETERWAVEDNQRDRGLVAAQKLTDGADGMATRSSRARGRLEGVFKERMFAGVEG